MSKSLLILVISVITSLVISPVLHAQDMPIDEYTKAIEESPEDMKYKFLNYRGKAYLKKGDINSAIEDFSMSISLNPTKEAYTERGKIYYAKKRYSPAINDFTNAIEINPSPELYELRGKSYLAQNMYDEAIEDGTQLVNLEPDNSEFYNLRLKAYLESGRLAEARQDCNRALQLDGQNTFALAIKEVFTSKKEIILEGNPNVSSGTSYATIDKSQDANSNDTKSDGNSTSSRNERNTSSSSSSNPCLPMYQEYIEYGHTISEWYSQNHIGITSTVKRDALITQYERMNYERNKMLENYRNCENKRDNKPTSAKREFEGVKKLERPNYHF